jgi:hypothetical protein
MSHTEKKTHRDDGQESDHPALSQAIRILSD